MKMKAMRKDFQMEIRRSLGRFLSIFFIVALGVAFFSGIRASQSAMLKTGDAYFDKYNLMDVKLVSTLGLTEENLDTIKALDGVDYAVGGYSLDVFCHGDEDQKVLHLISMTEDMNEVDVLEGRLPEKQNECIVDVDSDYQMGDEIWVESGSDTPIEDSLSCDKFTVVGRCASACYISFDRGSATIGTGSVNAFAYVPADAFCMDVYTEIYIAVDGAKDMISYTDEYDDAVEEVIDNIEAIKEESSRRRTEEVISEANEELEEAQKEFDDAKSEVEKELEDALQQIQNGEIELSDAKIQLDKAAVKIEKAKAELRTKQAELDQGEAQYKDLMSQYEAGLDEYNSGLAQYEQGLKEYNTIKSRYDSQLADYNALYEQNADALQSYEELEAYYEANADVMGEEEKLEVEAQLASLEAQLAPLYAAKDELDSTKSDLDFYSSALAEGEQKLTNGKQILDRAKNKLASSRKQLDDGQKKIVEGWKEINSLENSLLEARVEIAQSETELKEAAEEYEKGKLEAEEEIAKAEEEIFDAQKQIDSIEEAKWYIYDRSALPENASIRDNADRIAAIGEVFPILFFLVAALISLTSMTRMVEEQRTQIGTMKALGYDKLAISYKYVGYALVATLGGSVLGVLVGEKVIPWVITFAYCNTVYDHITEYVVTYNAYYAVTATLAALFCTVAATLFSCYKELMAQPAVLMRPPAPKKGKRVLLERIPFIWKRLSFIWKSTVRNLFRYKKRFFMTIFGIGGCMALLLLGFGIKDSIAEVSKSQFTRIQVYDGMAYLQEEVKTADKNALDEYLETADNITNYMDVYMSSITLVNGEEEWDTYMVVPEDEKRFEEFVVLADRITQEKCEMSDEGVILNEKAAKMLGVEEGDIIEIKDLEQGNHEVKILDICENYLGHYMYVTQDLYQRTYWEKFSPNCVYFTASAHDQTFVENVGKELLEQDAVLSINYLFNSAARVNDMLDTLNLVVFVLIISAGLLAFVVLYNLNNINITERRRELATLKVLGFYDGEVSAYVYRENIILTIIGAVVGVILGIIVHRFVIVTVEVENVMFGRIINLPSYIYSVFFTFLFSALVNWIMYFKLKKIDMVESLKSIE